MRVTCFAHSRRYPNHCSALEGVVNCNKCKFYLTQYEYEQKMEYLKEVRKRLRNGG